ncbi:alcohol dehydrogenase catalytic domain-containing protein [Hyphomicrobiales bacterium]|nr:alcohol dehydrogenase catalytic domain-containing protein [Hyphomicrobiales bacterium]MDC0139919.1 alcohol dehydrogenase catalytic domain-containing protein [Hyphomicrobiales bacterium]
MKALVLESKGTPFVYKDVKDPKPNENEAVIRVIACGSGLTIQHVRAGRIKVDYPRIIGHEITGIIEEVGSNVTNIKVGDAVTAYFYLTCGHCKWCRINRETLCENFGGYIGRQIDGAYAEYMKLPAENCLKIPEALDWKESPAEIAVICDAIATPVKVLRHASVTPNDKVVIMGAGGGLGIHMIMMAKWAHSTVIAVDIASDKFEACKNVGADFCVNPRDYNDNEIFYELTKGEGADVVIDFVSSTESLNLGFSILGRGGRLVTLGGGGPENVVNAAAGMLLDKEAVVMGSRYATKQEVIDSLDLVARGEIWPLVTDIRKMSEAEALHDCVEKGSVIGRAALLIQD